MTAVAAPPNIHTRPWSSGQHGLESMSSDYAQQTRGKPQRWSASASSPSGSENSGVNGWSNSVSGGSKKKGPTRLSGANGGGTLGNGLGGWPKPESGFVRASAASNGIAQPQAATGVGSRSNLSQQHLTNGYQAQQNGAAHPQAYLMLLPLNGTFDRKQIPLPYYPDTLRIGRQTNAKTLPSPTNGYFDSKVLSRQHAEVWAEKGTGKVWIRDIKSSNGTFVNGQRLSPENQDSDAQELKAKDILELGIDIVGEDNKTIVHHKVAARVEHAGIPGAGVDYDQQFMFGEVDVNGSFNATPVQNVRGRQGSAGPRSAGPSPAVPIAHRQIMMPSITMEMIVKKLNTELQSAKQQSKDLQKTAKVLDVFIAAASVKDLSNSLESDNVAQPDEPQINGIPSKEHGFVPSPAHPINGTDGDEAFQSESNKSDGLDPPRQLLSLVDALAQAKKEMELKASRVHDLEEALRKERRAREEAEDRALQLELASRSQKPDHTNTDSHQNHTDTDADGIPDIISISGLDADTIIAPSNPTSADIQSIESITAAAAEAALMHQKRLEAMMHELQAAKQQIEQYRLRAECAERERDADRKTLNEMIASLRRDEEKRRTRSASQSSQTDTTETESAGVQVGAVEVKGEKKLMNGVVNGESKLAKKMNGDMLVSPPPQSPAPTPPSSQSQKPSPSSPSSSSLLDKKSRKKDEKTLMASKRDSADTTSTAPYVTMIGVMVLGLSIMAVVNRWSGASER
ncbi:hypothetical protein EX30DRAFT_169039 [Ascodesmis nigricans]|uniref:FHA domain-containing protein n=1 Tax=Ascodesmis nigricans TaxID=341454 RepID=A0A4S2MRR5_9PEZI|nr:hypothetical protein EX30DRAFT_169039 [Ascodesmis nigricans]